MRGDLSDTTVPAICRSLASEGATGQLVLGDPDGPGTIAFRSGVITDASSPLPRARLRERLTGGGHLDELTVARVVHELRGGSPEGSAATSPDDAGLARGLLDRELADPELLDRMLIAPVVDALVDLFGRRVGEYRFEVAAAEEHGANTGGVHLEVERALVEVMRRSDEVADLPAVARSLDTIPLLLLDLPATPADFDADTLTVLTGIDDHSNLGEIAHRIGYGMFDVGHVIAGLYERSVVGLTRPQAGSATQRAQTPDPVRVASARSTGASQVGPSTTPADHGGSHRAPAERGRTPAELSRKDDPAPAPTPAGTPASQPAGPHDGAGATNGAMTRRAVATGDTDVSEFLRELSSLANRDDTRARRTTSPAPAAEAGRREPHDDSGAEGGEEQQVRAGTDHDADTPDDHRQQGSAPPSDDGRRRRRGFFGRG